MIDAPTILTPALIDRVLVEMQKGLVENIGWLNQAFGRAQRISKIIKEKTYIFPGCFAGRQEYIDVSPDSNIGNFSFFIMGEPQEINWIANQHGSIEAPFSLVFWFDIRKVHPAYYNERNTEEIKEEILEVISRKIHPREGYWTFNRIWERAENIYKEYPGVKELDNQFLLHPFGGFRFDGTLYVSEIC